MKVSLDCLPCFLNHALVTARRLKLSEAATKRIMLRVIKEIEVFETFKVTTLLTRRIQDILIEETGRRDLYEEEKHQANAWALEFLNERLNGKVPLGFAEAVRLAVAGNIIDLGANPNLKTEAVRESLECVVHSGFHVDHIDRLERAVTQAKRILYLGDNAGEIVFDKLLISKMPTGRVHFVVRGGPILNDVTRRDAEEVGMSQVAQVVDTGAPLSGILLAHCSPAFRALWQDADLVISKGQGNYESLCEDESGKRIFFLFMAKCRKATEKLQCPLNSYLVFDNQCGA